MTGRALLLSELERITANVARMLALVKPEHHAFRPQGNMRTLLEVANHLAQIPAIDLRILRGDKEQEITRRESELHRETGDELCEVLREGAHDFAAYYERLTFDDYENGSGTAYFGRTQTHAEWLLEAITHMYHHRAQLFMYLKLNGYEVNTRTLYEF
jgi:uncharacterized damage-inducible protein DinB